jgi:hypothetical protein
MQYGFLLWYSIPAQRSLCLTLTTVTVVLLFPFDVSRLGGIGRSMFDVHSLVSYSIKLAASAASSWAET